MGFFSFVNLKNILFHKNHQKFDKIIIAGYNEVSFIDLPRPMMKKFTSMTIALLLLVQLVLSPITFAQTGEQEGEVPEAPEMEVCILPWDDYKIFTNYRLNYQAAVADENPVFAQDLFESMQDILLEHCDAVASIIQVKTDGLDEACNDLSNFLLAKNNFYVKALDADNATATQ